MPQQNWIQLKITQLHPTEGVNRMVEYFQALSTLRFLKCISVFAHLFMSILFGGFSCNRNSNVYSMRLVREYLIICISCLNIYTLFPPISPNLFLKYSVIDTGIAWGTYNVLDPNLDPTGSKLIYPRGSGSGSWWLRFYKSQQTCAPLFPVKMSHPVLLQWKNY